MLTPVSGALLAHQMYGASYVAASPSLQRFLQTVGQVVGSHPELSRMAPQEARDYLDRQADYATALMRLTLRVRSGWHPVGVPLFSKPVALEDLKPDGDQTFETLSGQRLHIPNRMPLVMWKEEHLRELLSAWASRTRMLEEWIAGREHLSPREKALLDLAIYKHDTAEAAMGLVNFDSLTGLRNKRNLEALIPQLEFDLQRKRKNAPSDYFVSVDIDHFKRVNDNFGHAAGDKVLQAVAKALFDVRKGDYVFRNGGEEFLMFLANIGEEGVRRVAQRFRRRIEALSIEVSDVPEPIRVTASFGYSRFRLLAPSDLGVEDLPKTPALRAIKEADCALYAAKERGRNRVVSFQRMNP